MVLYGLSPWRPFDKQLSLHTVEMAYFVQCRIKQMNYPDVVNAQWELNTAKTLFTE